MGKFAAGVHVLLLVVVGHLLQQVIGQSQCNTTVKNGIDTCVCNIMDACDEHGKKRANWANYLPENVEQFGQERGRNLAYLCEGGTVAILYDCNSRIPLYAATKITGVQLSNKPIPRPNGFRLSDELDEVYQQRYSDYRNTNDLCLATYTKVFTNDNSNDAPSGNSVCSIERGHLIASQYGRAVFERMKATFTYTNVVPQFSSFNKGNWKKSENQLISWGQVNCAVKGAQHVEMFIIVGAVPSTYLNPPSEQPRYFGKGGFRVTQDPDLFRVNVPRYMWTAACCKYVLNGNWKYHNTAFYGKNDPRDEPCYLRSVARLFSSWPLQGYMINLFPQNPQCNDERNYISLR